MSFKFTKLRRDATGALSATATFNPSTGVFTAAANITTDGYVTTEDTASETYTLTPKASDALTTSGRTVTVPAGYYPNGASKSVSSSYVIPSGTKTISSSGTHDVKSYASASVAAGGCSVSGGALTAGAGAVSATGTNVTLTELSTAPSSGAYITVTGSGSVSRAAITKTQTAGYISAGTSTSSSATSKSSNTATKYYAITGNDEVYLYGVYQFISTPTGAGLSYDWGTIVSEPITFGWTGTSSGDPGTVYENIRNEIKVQYGSYGLAIWYGSDVAYTNTTYGGISNYTGWQAIDGMGSTTTRTIIIATPYRISSNSAFYQWFSNNTEKVDDWNGGTGGGGSTTTVSTCSLVTSGYPTSGRLFYTDAASCTQTMDINPGSEITTIACGKIYIMGVVSDIGVTSGGNIYPGTLITSMSSGEYLYEIEIPASLAGMEVAINY